MSFAPTRCRIVVLISGRGSNLEAIIKAIRDGALPADLCTVISNKTEAPGLDIARKYGIRTAIVDNRSYTDRTAFDHALMQSIDAQRPDLIVLAGFMRVLGNEFIDHYAGRLINIHPSLLPAFPGLRTHERALAEGAKFHGATVHFVTRDIDSGPIIVQSAVPVMPGDTIESLSERVLHEEHRIYPLAIQWFAQGRLTIRDGEVLVDGSSPRTKIPEELGR